MLYHEGLQQKRKNYPYIQYVSRSPSSYAVRVAMATFWRTFHHDGKGVHPIPIPFHSTLSNVTSKVVGHAPKEREDTQFTPPPISTLPLNVLCG